MSPSESNRILVTSALPYANGPLHVGHMAGAYLPGDVYCRYQRMKGREVAFICGSDEHGVPIMLRAREEGVDPQVVVDRYHEQLRKAFEDVGVAFDYYGRTSSERHAETSQDFFRKLAADGAFVQKTSSQLFDPEAKLFLADRLIRGTCPSCEYEDAYGDQCEKCGRALSPSELVDPRSAITNATPVLKETTHWYLPLGKHQPWLESWIGEKKDWKTNVLGQVRSWFQDGLGDRAVTRDLPWGVPVPAEILEGAGLEAEGKVLYVWFDAPVGYISATREWCEREGDPEGWKSWWQDESTHLVHFIGKDNIVFHCIIFPAMLKAHGDYVLPENVPANEFLNLENEKVSTSRGWAVWVHEFLEDFPADYLRFGLLRIMPETKDADFSWKELQTHIDELADTFGNLVNRTVQFATKNFEGKVPALVDPNDLDRETLAAMAAVQISAGKHIEEYRFREALHEVMGLARTGNKFFNDSAPWATRKTDEQLCANTVHVALQLCASLSVLMEPMLPHMAAKLRGVLRLEGVCSSMPKGEGGTIGWAQAGQSLLPEGHELGTPEILVTKITDEEVEAERAKLEAAVATVEIPEGGAYEALGETIVYDDFAKLDLRVGEILSAERVPKSDRLFRCQVNMGFEERQILAGVAEHFAPEDLVGKKVVVVANLKPRKMMGLESQGMILMAENREGAFAPVLADSEPGSTVS